MKKYPIETFFVGRINYSFPYESLLIPRKSKDDDIVKKRIVLSTIQGGAINLRDKLYSGNIDFGSRILYKPVFTIFYKEDNDKRYYCLHNWFSYTESGKEDTIEDLMPLSVFLPKVASATENNISFNQARKIFAELFVEPKNKNLYSAQTFLLDDFYTGDALLTTSEIALDKMPRDMNLGKHLIIANNGLTTCGGTGHIDEDGNVFTCIVYPTILLKVGKNRVYNVMDNQMYDDNGACQDSSACKVEIDKRIKRRIKIPTSLLDENRISIPEAVRLNRKRKS